MCLPDILNDFHAQGSSKRYKLMFRTKPNLQSANQAWKTLRLEDLAFIVAARLRLGSLVRNRPHHYRETHTDVANCKRNANTDMMPCGVCSTDLMALARNRKLRVVRCSSDRLSGLPVSCSRCIDAQGTNDCHGLDRHTHIQEMGNESGSLQKRGRLMHVMQVIPCVWAWSSM
eukprot:3513040-Amphidinium_carterae.1